MRGKIYSVRNIISAAEVAARMTAGTISGQDRHRPVQIWRTAVYLVGLDNGHSMSAIGRDMGRDHTTVLSALARYREGKNPTEIAAVDKAAAATRIMLRNRYIAVDSPALVKAREMADAFKAKELLEREQAAARAAARMAGDDYKAVTDQFALMKANRRLLAALRHHHGDMIGGAAC